MLPKRSGLDVLSDIKSDPALASIPVVIMTASQFDEDRRECDSRKVDAYVTKPVNLEKFLKLIQKLKRFWLDDVILPTVEP